MNADRGEFMALRQQVDGHSAALRQVNATLDELFQLMRDCIAAAGIDLDASPRREGRGERHLHLVKGGRP